MAKGTVRNKAKTTPEKMGATVCRYMRIHVKNPEPIPATDKTTKSLLPATSSAILQFVSVRVTLSSECLNRRSSAKHPQRSKSDPMPHKSWLVALPDKCRTRTSDVR